jgi:hypothetical protein
MKEVGEVRCTVVVVSVGLLSAAGVEVVVVGVQVIHVGIGGGMTTSIHPS